MGVKIAEILRRNAIALATLSIALITLLVLCLSLIVQNNALQLDTRINQPYIVTIIGTSNCPNEITDANSQGLGSINELKFNLRNIGRESATVTVFVDAEGLTFETSNTSKAAQRFVIPPNEQTPFVFSYKLNVSKEAANPEILLSSKAVCDENCRYREIPLLTCKYVRNETKEQKPYKTYELYKK